MLDEVFLTDQMKNSNVLRSLSVLLTVTVQAVEMAIHVNLSAASLSSEMRKKILSLTTMSPLNNRIAKMRRKSAIWM